LFLAHTEGVRRGGNRARKAGSRKRGGTVGAYILAFVVSRSEAKGREDACLEENQKRGTGEGR